MNDVDCEWGGILGENLVAVWLESARKTMLLCLSFFGGQREGQGIVSIWGVKSTDISIWGNVFTIGFLGFMENIRIIK